jgi:hypothetical protein
MFASKKNSNHMKALKITGIVLAALVVIVVILGFIAPKEFKVERSVIIPTDNKEVIFKNLTHWNEFLKWNPWSAMDPNQKLTFSGEEGTVGSSYTWEGNKDVGKGSMTIAALKENEMVDMDLYFIKPFEAKNKTYFNMTQEGSGYKVNWSMSGKSDFPMNIFGLFMNMDKMIGADFEKGLESLKKKCIEEAATPSEPVTADSQTTDTTIVK